MNEYRKHKIDDFIIEFTKFSQDCNANTFPGVTLADTLSEEEIEYLNKTLEIHRVCGYPKKELMHELLLDSTHDNLTFYLLRNPRLNYEVNSYDKLKSTVFIKLASRYFLTDEILFEYNICNLFHKGYIVKPEDLKYVKALYNKQADFQKYKKWVFLRFAVKLDDGLKLEKAYLNIDKMLTLLSIKNNNHLIFNTPNLLQVVVNGLSNYRDCGEIILETIEQSAYKDLIYQLDRKNRTFQKKRDAFLKNKPLQNSELKEIGRLILSRQ